MVTKLQAKTQIENLVQYFDSDIENQNIDEATARRQFISPFFQALGWDVYNGELLPQNEKLVKVEEGIKIGTYTKNADYTFHERPGKRIFFVEAKRPSVHIEKDIRAAFQVRNYGWNSNLNISVLTNFKEFAIYNTKNIEPNPTDQSIRGRLDFFKYTDYVEKFDILWDTFAYENVINGSIEQYAIANNIIADVSIKGAMSVDQAFLRDIESWRTVLAKNIVLRNKNISKYDLNYAVQKIIDRIIFLRIIEDRNLETFGNLKDAASCYDSLCKHFQKADKKYNSGLFHYSNEKGRGTPDTITSKLQIDDNVIRNVVYNLYDGKYIFDLLPAYILGSVYERFLGKEVVLEKQNATITEKPEVRKAGGVYYTPEYIVDYIVENTITKRNENIKILDPACGSGSFLLVAYQYMLDYYQRKKKDKLTLQERKQILLDHIFGVDIDEQAVEVTKLSLLLKVLEGELKDDLKNLNKNEKALPSLHNNIKCGNSLIDDKNIAGEKAFKWEDEFQNIFLQGGFDVVIGNPPYGGTMSDEQKKYCKQIYQSTKTIKGQQKGSLDTYVLFIEKSHLLVKKNGTIGMIIPMSFTSSDSVSALHNLLFETCSFLQVSSYSNRPQQIFQDAGLRCAIIKYKKDNKPIKELLSTKMQRIIHRNQIDKLLKKLQFVNVNDFKLYGRIPKISYEIEISILNKIFNCNSNIGQLKRENGSPIYYRTAGGRYFNVITNYTTETSTEKPIYFDNKISDSIGAILSSDLYYWFHQIYSDGLSMKQIELESFGIPLNKLTDEKIKKIEKLYSEYLIDIEENVNTRVTGVGFYKSETFKEYKIVYSKHLIDKIDDIICPLYGLTKGEAEYIKNYELEFRMRGEKK